VSVGDDQPLFRSAVVAALVEKAGIEVVSESEAGEAALAEIRHHRPDVAILDVRRPAGGAPGVMAALVSEGIATRVVILSDSLFGASAYAALAAGVSACISKRADADEVRSAVAAVARGETVVSSSLLNDVLAEIRAQAIARREPLSERERSILEPVARGHSSREIGQRLFIAPSTVKTYMARVYKKLGVHGHTAAVVEALRRGELREAGPR
jgi:two-component system nitrate/nitrite response regulator NarL